MPSYTNNLPLIAQLAEQLALNEKVPGSIPGGGILTHLINYKLKARAS